jgi:hypothetical protein
MEQTLAGGSQGPSALAAGRSRKAEWAFTASLQDAHRMAGAFHGFRFAAPVATFIPSPWDGYFGHLPCGQTIAWGRGSQGRTASYACSGRVIGVRAGEW